MNQGQFTLQKLYLQIGLHSEVLRISTWTYEFVPWGAQFDLEQMTNDQPLQQSYRGNLDSRISKWLISPPVLKFSWGTWERVQWAVRNQWGKGGVNPSSTS